MTLAPIAWLLNSDWVRTSVCASPILTEEDTWQRDPDRHPIRVAEHIRRDGVFSDLFAKLDRLHQALRAGPQ
ncbi:MAG: hypothetical protein ACLFVU_15160 [Phycisphaerae bacterium]